MYIIVSLRLKQNKETKMRTEFIIEKPIAVGAQEVIFTAIRESKNSVELLVSLQKTLINHKVGIGGQHIWIADMATNDREAMIVFY